MHWMTVMAEHMNNPHASDVHYMWNGVEVRRSPTRVFTEFYRVFFLFSRVFPSVPKFHCRQPGETGLCWVLDTESPKRPKASFYRGLPIITEFLPSFTEFFFRKFPEFSPVFQSSIAVSLVRLGFAGFLILKALNGQRRPFTEVYLLLPSFTEFYRVFSLFSRVFPSVPKFNCRQPGETRLCWVFGTGCPTRPKTSLY